MRSELNELLLIEQWLHHQLSETEAEAFETRLLLDEDFAENVEAQRNGYRLIRHYAMAAERSSFETIFRLLMAEVNFAHQINNIFT